MRLSRKGNLLRLVAPRRCHLELRVNDVRKGIPCRTSVPYHCSLDVRAHRRRAPGAVVRLRRLAHMSWLAAHLGIEEAPGADDLDSAIDRAARRVVAALKSSDVAREVVYEVIRRSS